MKRIFDKFIAIIEVFYLALCLIIDGIWNVCFNDLRVNFQIQTRPLKTNEEKMRYVDVLNNTYGKELNEEVKPPNDDIPPFDRGKNC